MLDDGEQLYIVRGPPGTGKTTYLADETRRLVDWARGLYGGLCKRPVLLCSLTRTAAAEIAGRDLPLPSDCVGTLHSHAYRSLGRPTVAETHLADFNEFAPSYRLSKVKADTDAPGWDIKQVTPGDKHLARYQLLRNRKIDRQLWGVGVEGFALQYEQWKKEADVVDFTDMIEQALLTSSGPSGDPLVLIADEAQDLSALEYDLLRKWGKAVGKLIITGDPWQALYCWRGAHPEIFLDPSIPASRRKVLSQSYRVPKAAHLASTRWIKQLSNYEPISYLPRDYPGRVAGHDAKWSIPRQALDTAEKFISQGKSVMIMAACSYLLTPTLQEARRRGLPFANPWRTKRGDWNPLGRHKRSVSMAERILAFLRMDRGTYGDHYRLWTAQELNQWVTVLAAGSIFQRGAKTRLAAMAQGKNQQPLESEDIRGLFAKGPFVELLRLFQAREDQKNPDLTDLLDWWENCLLGSMTRTAGYPLNVIRARGVQALQDKPTLYIGTIHSFKGAQADVVIIYPDLSPAGYREWTTRQTEGRDGIVRMFYVALTRARETVLICNPGSSLTVNMGVVFKE